MARAKHDLEPARGPLDRLPAEGRGALLQERPHFGRKSFADLRSALERCGFVIPESWRPGRPSSLRVRWLAEKERADQAEARLAGALRANLRIAARLGAGVPESELPEYERALLAKYPP